MATYAVCWSCFILTSWRGLEISRIAGGFHNTPSLQVSSVLSYAELTPNGECSPTSKMHHQPFFSSSPVVLTLENHASSSCLHGTRDVLRGATCKVYGSRPKDFGLSEPQVGDVCTAAWLPDFTFDEQKATWLSEDDCQYFVTLFTQSVDYGTKSSHQLIVPAVPLFNHLSFWIPTPFIFPSLMRRAVIPQDS